MSSPKQSARKSSAPGGLDNFLRDVAWRNERVINVFRAAIWLSVGLLTLTINLIRGRPITPGTLASLSWGTLAVLFGLWVLRRVDLGRWSALLSVGDVLVLAVMSHVLAVRFAPVRTMGETVNVIYVAGLSFLLICATNVLRFDWTAVIATSISASIAYAWLLHRHVPVDAGNIVINVFCLAAFAAMLLYSTRQLRTLFVKVQQRDAFARFLPGPAVERLSRDPAALELGGQEQEATVLFADIRGFTSLSSRLTPEAVVNLLNEYFAEMVDEIFRCEGILDKFIGDGICAVFGRPLGEVDQARRAVRCALKMLGRLETLNRKRAERGEPPLGIGIGLHTGKLVAGNIGSPLRLEYTHIGDTVNTASRIEGLTKELGRPLLASAATIARAGGPAVLARQGVSLEPMEPVTLRGKEEPMVVYALGGASAFGLEIAKLGS